MKILKVLIIFGVCSNFLNSADLGRINDLKIIYQAVLKSKQSNNKKKEQEKELVEKALDDFKKNNQETSFSCNKPSGFSESKKKKVKNCSNSPEIFEYSEKIMVEVFTKKIMKNWIAKSKIKELVIDPVKSSISIINEIEAYGFNKDREEKLKKLFYSLAESLAVVFRTPEEIRSKIKFIGISFDEPKKNISSKIHKKSGALSEFFKEVDSGKYPDRESFKDQIVKLFPESDYKKIHEALKDFVRIIATNKNLN